MKTLIILGDGMADEPIDELGGKTPLQYADTPFMDTLARLGTTGRLKTVADGFHPGSEVANMAGGGGWLYWDMTCLLFMKDVVFWKQPVWG